jgi:hypothetical protein
MRDFLYENRLLLLGAVSFALASIALSSILRAMHVRF